MSFPVVLLCGTSRGIGLAIAESLLEQSPDVRILGVSRNPPPSSLMDSPRFEFVAADLSTPSTGLDLIRIVETMYGRLDTLIYNAGTLDPLCRLENLTPKALTEALNTNLVTFMELIRHGLPMLRKSPCPGRVIGVSSGAAVKARPGWGAYCLSKAGMNMVLSSLAVEEPGITSIAFRPGVVDTDMQQRLREEGKEAMGEDAHQVFVNLQTEGRLLDPSVPGKRIAELALNAPQSVSGQFLSV